MTENKRMRSYTPVFRVSFPEVFEAKSFQGSTPKYQVTMLFPKSLFEPIAETDTEQVKSDKEKILNMRKMAMASVKEKWGDDSKKINAIKNKIRVDAFYPFRDGDIEKSDLDGYPSHYFAVASSKRKPGLVDQNINFITNENKEDFYSGCYAIATINTYAYDIAGNIGVAFGLQNLKKEAEGESFSGGSSALDDFADFAKPNSNSLDDDFLG